MILGRPALWVICVLPDEGQLELAKVESPYYSVQSEPIYARRFTVPRADWNAYSFIALYPVLTSRLRRIINVINQPIDLFPVFSENSSCEDEFPL